MSFDEEKLQQYYNIAMTLVMKCGPLMREGYETNEANFHTKSAFYDLVTDYDSQIENILINGLRKEFPESKFIGEETAKSESDNKLTDDPTWIIDPIDGTSNFIKRIPLCCISVGLAIRKELVVGIVYNPIANEMYSARRGHGAYLNGQRIHVSNCKEINNAVLGYEISLIHCDKVRDKNVKRIAKIGQNCTGIRCLGSAAITICYIACGRLDCYHVEDLKCWDIAGAAVILREAGGVLYYTDGTEFNIMKPDLVCASTQSLVEDVMRHIEEANQINEFSFA